MAEIDVIAREIAKQIGARADSTRSEASRDIFATIRVSNDGTYALLDGGEEPTPVTSAVEVHHGDRVIVHIVDHRAVVVSNVTVPSVNDGDYTHVKSIAEEADELLDGVAEAAATADKTVAEILADANTSSELVSGMQVAADTAGKTLAQIVADADSASATLSDMQEAAEAANTTLLDIYQDAADAAQAASDAQDSADTATLYASSALGQLGVVQDVIGVLTWASEHGTFTLTQDQSVQDGKVYFTYDSSTHDYSPVVDPQASGLSTYYELSVDEAMDSFIMSHLAVTSRGLWVLPNGINTGSVTPATGEALEDARARLGSRYKMLLANDGTYIYDGSGVLVAQYKGDGISYADGRSYHIGSDDAYILYTPASGNSSASITIGGSNVVLGESRTLSQLMAQVDGTLLYDHEYEMNAAGTQATFTAHLYSGGVDVAGDATHPASQFTWYRKSETPDNLGNTLTYLGDGLTCTVNMADMGYGSHIVGRYTTVEDSPLLTEDDDEITDSEDNPLTGRTPSGESVRVSDLSVATALYDTEKLLIVGAEDEHLVTVGDFIDHIPKPSIEDVVLVGNNDFPDLGIFQVDQQGYDVPDDYSLTTMDINALWTNAVPVQIGA